MRLRLIAPVLLVLAVTAGGFLAALLLPERDARGEARHRADIAATEVRGGVEQGANLVESLRRFMLGQVDGGITNAQFEDVGARWLSPVGLPAAAWVEQLQKPRAGRVSLRATLATGAAPMTAPGIDLGGEAVLAAAVVDPRTLFRVTATPFARVRDGRTGIFLVQSAPRLSGGVLRPGFVVLFLPGSWLLAQVTEETNPGLRLRIGDTSYGGLGNATAVGSTFSAAGRRFDVLGPQEPVRGAAAVLPWLVLGGGLVLAALAGTLAAIAERRARAQRDVDRIFTLSPDLITVAGFDGFWKRVNPAFETRLGYTEREALARPSLEFVHPDDRERSEAAAIRLGEGETILAFENRLVCKDGSYRWIEWTATPVLDEGVFYSAGRDVTERRQAESEAARLGQEQAALRRVATLVAEGAPEAKLYDCVAREVAQVLGVPMVTIDRFDSDASSTVVASVDDPGFPVGSRWPLDGPSLGATVLETARPARVDDYAQLQSTSAAAMRTWAVKSAAGVPILVDGRVWGVICVGTADSAPLPAGTEARLADFTELLATGIARADSRAALARLADEQAALRRVATLVARGVRPDEIFSAVSEEVDRLLGSSAAVLKFEHEGPATVFVGISKSIDIPIGTRWEFQDGMASAEAYRTGRSARVDAMDWSSATGTVAATARRLGVVSTVVSPIVVEGRLWGAMSVSSTDEPLPLDSEERLERFTELVATAISNAEGKSELAASRRRIVAASDEARRRIERDLHDGTQQRLVSLGLSIRSAEADLPSDRSELRAELSRIAAGLADAVAELQELSRGIHPAILSQGGLGPALRTLARRSTTPVELDVATDARLPEPIEVAAYYVASEALANAAKHAQASRVEVSLALSNGSLLLSIRDDGVGGADPAGGSGLLGLTDRVEALGGSIQLESRPGDGTQITAELPLELELGTNPDPPSAPD